MAELCSDPSQADAILKAANEIEAMAAALTELRSQGQVNENHEIFHHCSIYSEQYSSLYMKVICQLFIQGHWNVIVLLRAVGSFDLETE